jgi:hypothetical protein
MNEVNVAELGNLGQLDAEGTSADPHKLSHRVAIRALQRYAATPTRRAPSVNDFRAFLEVLDEYQAETERRLAALEARDG